MKLFCCWGIHYLMTRCYKHFSKVLLIHVYNMQEDNIWSFAYGSNMNIEQVEKSKDIKILDHVPAILKGWKLVFNPPGMALVEPAFANISKGDTIDEVHGVAVSLTKEGSDRLDKIEFYYHKIDVIVDTYDGRHLKGYAYAHTSFIGLPQNRDDKPSLRYVNLVIQGARKACLKESYINNLLEVETYNPSPETLALRATLPDPKSLPQITVENLAKHNGTDVNFPDRVAVLGYVVEPGRACFGTNPDEKAFLGRNKGRDITTRFLLHFHYFSVFKDDDLGQPPYPIIKNLTADEKEHIARWLDHYISRTGGKVVGYVKEFHEQQLSGTTLFKLPYKL